MCLYSDTRDDLKGPSKFMAGYFVEEVSIEKTHVRRLFEHNNRLKNSNAVKFIVLCFTEEIFSLTRIVSGYFLKRISI